MGIKARNKTGIHLLLLAALGILVYSNSLRVPFVFDDQFSITHNPAIRNLGNFFAGTSGDEHQTSHLAVGQQRRFVSYLTFALNYHFGGLEVVGYHLVNLLIHLANACLVYALVRLTFRSPHLVGSRLAPRADTAALLCALFFVAHPVQTQAVTYIVQRQTSLAALFFLLAVVLYAAGRLRMENGGQWTEDGETREEGSGYRRGLPWLAGAVLSAVLGMKTKEVAFTLPFAVLLYEISFFRGTWRRRLLYLTPLLLLAPIVPMSVLSADGDAGELLSDVSEQVRAGTRMSRWDYLFTQFRVIVTYLRLLVLPINQNLDYDYPVYTTFFTPPVFFSFVLLASLFVLAIYLYRLKPRDSALAVDPAARLIGFGILWFFLTLAVESSLIPIVDVIFEHRVYLPSVGAAVVFAAAVVLVIERFFERAGLGLRVAVVALIVLPLGVATYQRNQVWGDSGSLWTDVVRKSPAKSRPKINLGMVLNARGEADAAMEQLSEALKIDPNSAEAHTNLGLSYLKKSLVDAAVREFHLALAVNPNLSSARLNLGAALYDRGEVDAAMEQYLAAVKSDPDNDKILNNLGVAYFRKGKVDQAIAHLRRAIALNPDYPEAHYNLGIAYGGKGWIRQAQEEMVLGMRLKKTQEAR